jgi:hypothetical protein
MPRALNAAIAVLFVGNSLTAANDLPHMVAALGAATHHPITVEMRAPGGYALEDHWQLTDLPSALARGGYDWVVMQQGPSSLPDSGESLRTWAVVLADAARAAGARPALLTVWPESYRRSYALDWVIANYRRAARACTCALMPAGVLWKSALARVLYGPDGFHPSRLGTYAAAVVVFSRVTGVSPVGLPRLGLNAQQVSRIQRAAAAAQKTASF